MVNKTEMAFKNVKLIFTKVSSKLKFQSQMNFSFLQFQRFFFSLKKSQQNYGEASTKTKRKSAKFENGNPKNYYYTKLNVQIKLNEECDLFILVLIFLTYYFQAVSGQILKLALTTFHFQNL